MTDLYTAFSKWAEDNAEDPDCKRQISEFKMNDQYYKRRSDKGVDWHTCGVCGIPQDSTTSDYDKLKSESLCFSCDFWLKKNYEDPSKFVINSAFYGDAGKKKAGTPYLGFSGREFLILDHKSNRIIYTNNLWCAGDIPKRFEKQDTAEFIGHSSSEETLRFVEVIYKNSLCEQGLSYFNQILRGKEIEKERAKQPAKKGLGFPF